MTIKIGNKIGTAPRIDQESADFYQSNFKNLNAGCQWALETMPKIAQSKLVDDLRTNGTGESAETALSWVSEAIPILVQRTLAYELRGVFTKAELFLILNSLQAKQVMTTPQLSGQHVLLAVKTAFDLNPTVEKSSGVNKANLLEKLNDLTVFQSAALEYWVAMCKDKNEHVKMLL